MIEDLFPKTVSNILDYDAIKAAAKKYVEETFVQIVESFGNNMVLQYMDEEHLSEVAYHVSGDRNMTVEQLLDYINSENIYRECDFVLGLLEEFPEGVEYKAFEVTGYGFPNGDIPPFNGTTRSFKKDGTPQDGHDELWESNADGGHGERNLLMSRFKGQFPSGELPPEWKRKPGRRASWGNEETWMTTGGFGKPSTIHINVDEERTVIEENGLSSVENWLGTVSNKLPINLYIEINTTLKARSESSYTLKNSFVYSEEEIFCTNDPAYEVFPEHIEPPEPPAETFPIGGSMGADYSESMTATIAERMERGGIGFTGLLREDFIPESGVVEADSDGSIEILLGSQWNGSTWAGSDVQYQNSSIARLGIMNQTDADAVVAYGLTLTGEITAYHSGPFGFINYNSNYEFEVVGVYTDVSGETPISTDVSWFAMNYNNNWVNLGGAGWGPPYLVSGIKTVRLKIKAPST